MSPVPAVPSFSEIVPRSVVDDVDYGSSDVGRGPDCSAPKRKKKKKRRSRVPSAFWLHQVPQGTTYTIAIAIPQLQHKIKLANVLLYENTFFDVQKHTLVHSWYEKLNMGRLRRQNNVNRTTEPAPTIASRSTLSRAWWKHRLAARRSGFFQ